MYRLCAILLFCFAFLSCNKEPKGNSTHPTSEQKEETRLSINELEFITEQFDSLKRSLKHYQVSNNNDSISKYLNEYLSFIQQLKNDSMKAVGYEGLSNYFDEIGDYHLEVEFHYKAFELGEKNKYYYECVRALNNMAWAYIQANDFKKGIEMARLGLDFAKKLQNDIQRNRMSGYLYNNLAIAYQECNMPDTALKYNELSLSSVPNLKEMNINHYAWVYAEFGDIYMFKKDYAQAEYNFKKVIEVKDTIAVADAAVFAISKYCHLLNTIGRSKESISLGRDGINIARNTGYNRYLIDIAEELSISFEKLHDYDSAFAYSKMASQLRKSFFNTQKTIQLQSMSFSRDLKEKELKFEIEKAKSEEKLENAQALRNVFLWGFVFVMLFAVTVLYQRNKIKAGKIRSDELLLNILPEEVAEELKIKGSTDAKQFDNVTVMFTDFKNFTQIAERLSPQELVSEIHTCFKAFDEIIGKYQIEKIKTIGDAYMCVGGLPVSNSTHAVDVVQAALEIQQFILQHSSQRKAAGKELFEIRIGIHTGPVVAGIVGIKKFAYDIWGDTVNIASRMESSGEVGKVNISETTYELVKGHFNCTYRGKIQVKNKGELDMYFISQPIAL